MNIEFRRPTHHEWTIAIDDSVKEESVKETFNVLDTNKFKMLASKVKQDREITIFMSSPFDGYADERKVFADEYFTSLNAGGGGNESIK